MRRGRPRNRRGTEPPDWGAQLDQLSSRLASFGLRTTPEINSRIERFCSQLVVWNESYALVSRQDVGNVLQKHVAASLGPLLLVHPNPAEQWVDVGSGAGFPGLVLKLWCPDQQITLIDGSRKKCLFLEQVARDLDLAPLPILQLRVETLVARGELVGAFDILFARAVADLAATLRYFGPLVRAGGRIISFKGPAWPDDVRQADEQGLLGERGFVLEEVMRIPWAPGHLLKIRKNA